MPVFVNNVEITDDDVHVEMQHHPAPTVEEARRQASRALIIRRLLLEAAVAQGLTALDQLEHIDEEKEELVIEALIDKVIRVPTADRDICRRYYDQNPERFIDKSSKRTLPFEMVENHIKNYIEDKGHMSALNTYIDTLMDTANIIGFV